MAKIVLCEYAYVFVNKENVLPLLYSISIFQTGRKLFCLKSWIKNFTDQTQQFSLSNLQFLSLQLMSRQITNSISKYVKELFLLQKTYNE